MLNVRYTSLHKIPNDLALDDPAVGASIEKVHISVLPNRKSQVWGITQPRRADIKKCCHDCCLLGRSFQDTKGGAFYARDRVEIR